MAGHPKDRMRFTTDVHLLNEASAVPLVPPVDRTVFYAEDEGAKLALAFVTANPGFMRLDDLIPRTPRGSILWSILVAKGKPWSNTEEIWWELSWRLARAAKGVVNVFGPRRLIEDRPLSEFAHKYVCGAYANTVFEKVELPELEANLNVTAIFYNGLPFENK